MAAVLGGQAVWTPVHPYVSHRLKSTCGYLPANTSNNQLVQQLDAVERFECVVLVLISSMLGFRSVVT